MAYVVTRNRRFCVVAYGGHRLTHQSSNDAAGTLPSGADALTFPGPEMVGLIGAVGALGEAGIGRYTIVDGVAVTVGLGNADRVTVDVDTVVDETTPPDAVEAFLARSDTRQDPTEPHRVFVDRTKVEILPVRPLDDNDLNGISTNDARFVAAHAVGPRHANRCHRDPQDTA